MSGAPDTLPANLPARWRLWPLQGDGRGHVFEVHIENGHLIQDGDGNIAKAWMDEIRFRGISTLRPQAFGVYVLLVGGYCKKEDAQALVAAWAQHIAEVVGEIHAQIQARPAGGSR